MWRVSAIGRLNLGMPDAEIPGRVEQALRDVGLDASFRNRSSHPLSQGERKRVALASVLVMEPAILALDEPRRTSTRATGGTSSN